MKKKTTFKWPLIVIFCVAVLSIGYYFFFAASPVQEESASAKLDQLFGWRFPSEVKFPSTGSAGGPIAYSDIRDPGGIPEGLPVRLKIPVIGVNSAIEDALITPDGRMDVPAGSLNVAWFSLGPHPGQVGSAVIGGHFGIRNGVKFVFYDLDKLKVGDKVYIEDDKGDTLAFQVRSIRLFNREDDAADVFTSSDGLAHLNLITCEGIWNRVKDNYPQRRVIFTDAIDSKDAIAPIAPSSGGGITKAQDIAAFSRILGIGSKGVDVAALQNILVEKGFLVLPKGMAPGYYGTLTSVAISKYQTSAGLPAVGTFGPRTKAKLLAELGGDTGLPNAGEEDIPSTTAKNQGTLMGDLFSTPMDAVITLLLGLAIVFVAFKIIRK